MNIDLDKFIEAITITDKKYGSGNTRWINYLYQGDIHCFTSTNGARDLIASYDYKMVQQMVITKIFENLKFYLEKTPYQSINKAANYIVDWISKESLHIVELNNLVISRFYHDFVYDFAKFENLFGNDVVFDLLVGNITKMKKGVIKIENVDVILTLLQQLIRYSREDDAFLQDVKVDSTPFVRVPFLDSDLERFMQAIEITDQKYGIGEGKVSYPEYLTTGNTMVFTSSDGARNLVESLDWKTVRFKVLIQMFQNMLTYFQSTIPFQLPMNSVIVNFIERVVWEFENSSQLSEVFSEVVDNLFANAKRNSESLNESLDILVGNIKPDMKCLPKKELEEHRKKVCEYLQRLVSYAQKQVEVPFALEQEMYS